VPGTFVVGHGAYYVDGQDTFVPTAMTVHLYADEGEGIPAPNVIEILRYRGGRSVRTISAGEPIKNLILQQLSRNQYETELGAVQPGELVCFVGYDHPATGAADYTLCMGTCDQAQGVHNCAGIFGKFNGVTELHLLACLEQITGGGERIMEDRENLPWEGEPQHYQRIGELAGEILEAAGYDGDTGTIKDYDSAKAAKIFDNVPYEDQVKLMTYEPVQRWSYVRYARQTLIQLGEERFRTWCRAQEEWVREIYRKDPDGIGKYLG